MCGGTGETSWTDLLVPWAVVLVCAGVLLTLGEWVWKLFHHAVK
jgi:hypothetical protein